jgi:hypothetical protein
MVVPVQQEGTPALAEMQTGQLRRAVRRQYLAVR